jgi:hypothetical protein
VVSLGRELKLEYEEQAVAAMAANSDRLRVKVFPLKANQASQFMESAEVIVEGYSNLEKTSPKLT